MKRELELEPISVEHDELVKKFQCSLPYGAELVKYLKERALDDQNEDLSTTFLLLSQDRRAIYAFVTLSNASIVVPNDIRKELRFDRKFVPAVMIDYIAVSDEARRQRLKGIGRDIFDRVKADALKINAISGVRFVILEVHAGNWAAYKVYARDWNMKALPVRATTKYPECPAPDPEMKERPADLAEDRFITMYLDLYEWYGRYWPRPSGVE